jgi:hypothetical protein
MLYGVDERRSFVSQREYRKPRFFMLFGSNLCHKRYYSVANGQYIRLKGNISGMSGKTFLLAQIQHLGLHSKLFRNAKPFACNNLARKSREFLNDVIKTGLRVCLPAAGLPAMTS